MSKDDQITSLKEEANLRVHEDLMYEGQPFFLVKNAWYSRRQTRVQKFAVNDNGSISPIEAPHLALGFYVLARN